MTRTSLAQWSSKKWEGNHVDAVSRYNARVLGKSDRTPVAGCAVVWAFVGALAAGAAWAEDPGFPAPNGDPSVLPAGAKLDRVFGGACALPEGVATSPQGIVYFSDITFTTLCKDASGKFLQAGNIWQYD